MNDQLKIQKELIKYVNSLYVELLVTKEVISDIEADNYLKLLPDDDSNFAQTIKTFSRKEESEYLTETYYKKFKKSCLAEIVSFLKGRSEVTLDDQLMSLLDQQMEKYVWN